MNLGMLVSGSVATRSTRKEFRPPTFDEGSVEIEVGADPSQNGLVLQVFALLENRENWMALSP
jgi:hypothetical protein